MNIPMIRTIYTEKSTIGNLIVDNAIFGHTLEDVVRRPGSVKIYGETAIPAKRYKVIVTMSTRFKKPLPLLLDVEGFTGIRMHGGNKVEDTLGCILTAERIINNYTIQGSIAEELVSLLLDHDKEENFIEIFDSFPYFGIQ